MAYIKLELTLASLDDWPQAVLFFDEVFPEGFEQYDPRDILAHLAKGDWDAHEYSADILAEDQARLTAYLAAEDRDRLAAIKGRWATLGLDGAWTLTPYDLPDQDAWRDQFQPMKVTDRIELCPYWASPLGEGSVVVLTNPGIGFGTGTDETTQLALDLLDWADPAGKRVCDLGCGSGILAVAAKKCGAGEVLAVDNDPQAVAAAADMARLNQVDLTSRPSDLLQDVQGQWDIIIANIVTDVLLALIPSLSDSLAPAGQVLLSGIHKGRLAEIQQQAAQYRLIEEASRIGQDWCGLALKKG
ncbi:50S ribosomal protein L11 methyltransferase [Peptococcus simiae]|uniref:50S ribosomal protein L11 methyltransferase n=1 Tax=Peptococcus simiae TaxID=1643805 RepID=UPI003980BE56